jgi:hypothetical protein
MHDEYDQQPRALGIVPGDDYDAFWREHLQRNGVDPDVVEACSLTPDVTYLGSIFKDELIRAGALRSVYGDDIAAVTVVAYRRVHASDAGKRLRHATRATSVSGHRRPMVSLRGALDQLPGPPMTIGALRKASTRSGFPKARSRWQKAKLYDLDELVRWKSARDAV